ncbi:hypothetical protein BJ170DRAFT_677365 [Xylariales sp. AK1849]|nr:hypothetical protein BJ170DRAFT_677365 [Xylariales sp. AK1849]
MEVLNLDLYTTREQSYVAGKGSFFVSSIQWCLSIGSLIAGIINQSMPPRADDSSWQTVTPLPAVIIMCLLYFTPKSPGRWLIFDDRSDEALATRKNVRVERDFDLGVPESEIVAMREDGQTGKEKKIMDGI